MLSTQPRAVLNDAGTQAPGSCGQRDLCAAAAALHCCRGCHRTLDSRHWHPNHPGADASGGGCFQSGWAGVQVGVLLPTRHVRRPWCYGGGCCGSYSSVSACLMYAAWGQYARPGRQLGHHSDLAAAAGGHGGLLLGLFQRVGATHRVVWCVCMAHAMPVLVCGGTVVQDTAAVVKEPSHRY
jgi:hypothetical protein